MRDAVIFEMTNPGWENMDGYEDGAGGQVLSYLEELGLGDYISLVEGAEENIKQHLAGAEGDPYAFMRNRAKNGLTWYTYCAACKPTLDKNGFVNGAWGECLTDAVIFEHQNPAWDQLPAYSADGPAGQVINYFGECGHGDQVEAMDRTEQASHQAYEEGSTLPVFDATYQTPTGEQAAQSVNEDPPEMTGKKKALLVGVNYFGTKAELGGCINDTHMWKELLQEVYGFEDREILMLTDDQDEDSKKPTLDSMRAALRWLVAGASPGDVLFFQFSGHGTQQKSTTEDDGYDEALCPCDYRKGLLVDDEVFDLVVRPLPSGVKLTIVLDCCHSGTAVDLPFIWDEGGSWEPVQGTIYAEGDVQMFSGCMDEQTSADVSFDGKRGGAMTLALTKALREDPNREYEPLLNRLHEILEERSMEQRPRLSSSQQFDATGRQFSLVDGALPNMNETIGTSVPPRKHESRPTGLLGFLFG
eukprot:TRINITY_DN35999_c0_g1_i1.p1 TRINITY_DN35999_c0_g1~~TRINITY_DN35999_c0_g1_i1.p1  ORF type:complete len:525 (+),score=116.85 TRINITY_DN35999_c0_g1_i1:159-1577(+)